MGCAHPLWGRFYDKILGLYFHPKSLWYHFCDGDLCLSLFLILIGFDLETIWAYMLIYTECLRFVLSLMLNSHRSSVGVYQTLTRSSALIGAIPPIQNNRRPLAPTIGSAFGTHLPTNGDSQSVGVH